jgi:hypothetical protein
MTFFWSNNKVHAVWIYNTNVSDYSFEVLHIINCVPQSIILGIALGCIVMALPYLVKSAIFETAAFAIASILGYFVVYRWFQRWED